MQGVLAIVVVGDLKLDHLSLGHGQHIQTKVLIGRERVIAGQKLENAGALESFFVGETEGDVGLIVDLEVGPIY